MRSLINNFCKLHGLNPAHFRYTSFYAWEKFLYGKCSCGTFVELGEAGAWFVEPAQPEWAQMLSDCGCGSGSCTSGSHYGCLR